MVSHHYLDGDRAPEQTLLGAAEMVATTINDLRHHRNRNIEESEHPAGILEGEGVVHPSGGNVAHCEVILSS